jgi:hypothetical protein
MLAEQIVTNRWVYSFGGGGADGDAAMKNLLGGKGLSGDTQGSGRRWSGQGRGTDWQALR